MTTNFRHDYSLGRGGFRIVYRGYITEYVQGIPQQVTVAVKVYDGNYLSKGHREWLDDVTFLGQFSNPNLVKLIGYCSEDEHQVLIYEYMTRESVENNLFSSHLAPWSDVYNFGVVLLKLVTGARALDLRRPTDQEMLTDWARLLVGDKRKVLQIVDARLGGQYPIDNVHKVVMLADNCINLNPKAQPHMRDIVNTLEALAARSN